MGYGRLVLLAASGLRPVLRMKEEVPDSNFFGGVNQ